MGSQLFQTVLVNDKDVFIYMYVVDYAGLKLLVYDNFPSYTS